MSSWPSKDPDDVLDYKIDWTARLAGDQIVSSQWFVPEALESRDEAFNSTSCTIWLLGGVAAMNYLITNRITTAGGRTIDKSVNLPVRNA